MNIGIVVDNDLNADIRVLRELRILRERHDISVLCFAFRGKDYKQPVEGIKISRIRIPGKLKNALFFFQNLIPAYEWLWTSRIRKFIIENNIDHLHVHDLYMSRAANSAIRKTGRNIPMTLDLHENYPYTVKTYSWTKGFPRKILSRPGLWKKKEFRYLSYATDIIVLSSEFSDSLISEYPDLKSTNFIVYPNVPDLSQPEYTSIKKPENPFHNEYPVLLYYGVIAERRGIFETFDVFEKVIKDARANLLLIGPVDRKDQARFMEKLNSLKSSGCVHYIPWINASEFPGYLAMSDICLAPFHKNPQHESGVANKIFDYMLGGKPLIVSDCKPQQTLIEKYNCGLVFSTSGQYRDAILRLLNDRQLREDMGENGKKAILTDYNAGIFRNNLLGIYTRQS